MDTAEHRSELGQWKTAHRAADPRLRAYVRGYFATSSSLHTPVEELHVPSTEVCLLLNFGSPHRRLNPARPGDWSTRDGAWVVGLHNRHQLTEAVGERQFMIARFTPIGAHLFFGLPMHEIANQAIELDAIDRVFARALMSRISGERSWTARFAAIESMIGERVADAAIPASVGLAWRRLIAADGRIALGSLVNEMDCSHRTLIARFRGCVGFPPKTIARLLRFNRAVRSLGRLSGTRADAPAGKPYIAAGRADGPIAGPIQWADVAADCGYFDQAHLIKDFQEFAGITPDGFARRMSFTN